MSPTVTTARLWKQASSRSIVMLPDGTGEGDVADSLDRHADPGGDDQTGREAGGHDDELLEDLRHGLVDTNRHLEPGLRARQALAMTESVAVGSWRHVAGAEPTWRHGR